MGKQLKEKVENLQTEKTRNISELEKVPVNIEIETYRGEKENGETFSFDYIVVDEVKYRIPFSVQEQLKGMLEEKPDIEFFKVKRTGTGINDTKYQVFEVTEKSDKQGTVSDKKKE